MSAPALLFLLQGEDAPPGTDWITLAEARAYLRVDGPEEDALIQGLIDAAKSRIEHATIIRIQPTPPTELQVYDRASLPPVIRMCGLMLIALWYDDRTASKNHEGRILRLLDSFRIWVA